MSIHVIHADLSNLPFYVDFILNTANPEPRDGNGLDRAIYQKAGPEMREDRKKIGNIAPGDIAITKGYGLNTQGVIHAVSTAWRDGFHDEELCIQKCYRKALNAAVAFMEEKHMQSVSIAMPLIGTGIYQIPREISIAIAFSESIRCVLKHNVKVYIVAFDADSVKAMREICPVEEYLSPMDTQSIRQTEYTRGSTVLSPESIHRSILQSDHYRRQLEPLDFCKLLQKHMDSKEISGPQIYKNLISRQSFSDIQSGKKSPKKETAILIAIQLKLSLAELEEFLNKAGYSLSDDNEEDRLTKEFFSSPCRDVLEYNMMRDAHGFEVPCK